MVHNDNGRPKPAPQPPLESPLHSIRNNLKPFAARASAIGAFLACALHTPVTGAIVGVGPGTGNTTAPPGTPAFDNVARYRLGSAVYLGDRWLLTAGHVYGGIDTDPIIFNDGGPAFTQQGSGINLVYPGPGGGRTDLSLIRITTDPGLPQIVFGATPTVGTPIVMAGFGRNRQTELTRWNSNTDPWTELASGGDALGYKYAPGTSKRWADNVISADDDGSVTIEYDTESHLGKVILIGAEFSRTGGTPNEGIVANGDSGGGVFANNRLIGMPLYLGTYENQPEETAVFGNVSYFANLASYVDQISAITRLLPSTAGDANLDGIVDTADFDILRAHFGQSAGWTRGDFTLDGAINFADFQVLERNFSGVMPVDAAETLKAVSVPEPAMGGLLLAAIPLLSRGRRTRR